MHKVIGNLIIIGIIFLVGYAAYRIIRAMFMLYSSTVFI